MVKSVARKESLSSSSSASTTESGRVVNSNITNKYKGVRKRKWGKYVSEIRLPNSRERIWLGSYDTAEKAARAFDAALFCLRGKAANFNFPDNPPDIVNGRSMSPSEIQVAAARFANSEGPTISGARTESVRVDHSDNSSSTSSSSSEPELHADSPCPSISDGVVPLENEMAEIPLDTEFLDMFSTMGTANNNVADFGIFPGFDDFFASPLPNGVDYGEENYEGFSSSQDSILWNF